MKTKEKIVKTYRERTQELIRQMWVLYDGAGNMRDFADDKDPWNKTRGLLYDAAIALSRHDDAISTSTAKMETWADDNN